MATIGSIRTLAPRPSTSSTWRALSALRGSTRANRAARSSAGASSRQGLLAVGGDPGAEAALALALAESVEVDSDPVDAGRIGGSSEAWVVRPEGENELLS